METLIGFVVVICVVYALVGALVVWSRARHFRRRKELAMRDPEAFKRELDWEKMEHEHRRGRTKQIKEDYAPAVNKVGGFVAGVAVNLLKSKLGKK